MRIPERPAPAESILHSIQSLPKNWNPSGGLHNTTLDRIFECAQGAQATAETGCGKSTLALSHASRRHIVFTCEAGPGEDPQTHSLNVVRKSPLLDAAVCQFVIGRTQQTLPAFNFNLSFDLVLLDGPHGYPFPDLEYYYFYPHIRPGGWLVIDDVHIPTVARMVDVLKRDAMFSLEFSVRTTAFLRRTGAPTFDPLGDGWWEQGYNRRRRLSIRHVAPSQRPKVFAMGLARRLGLIR